MVVVVVEKQVVTEEKVRVPEKARVSKRVTLKVGSEGEEVQAMQVCLQYQKIFLSVLETKRKL